MATIGELKQKLIDRIDTIDLSKVPVMEITTIANAVKAVAEISETNFGDMMRVVSSLGVSQKPFTGLEEGE